MKKLICFLLSLSLSPTIFAFQVPPQPEKCPGTSTIQQTYFISAKRFNNGTYGTFQIARYDTQETWAFVVAGIMALSPEDALNKASAALKTLSLDSGPSYISAKNLWACFYYISSGYQAVSITPLPGAAINAEPLFNATPPLEKL